MLRINRLKSGARSLLLLAYVGFCCELMSGVPSFAATSNEASQSPAKVNGVRFTVSAGEVIVHYNLKGNPVARYVVTLILRKTDDPSYRYFPRIVSGDVGTGTLEGMNRKIVWQMDQEIPGGLPGSDYYFEVLAHKLVRSETSWFVPAIEAGAAVLLAGAAYLLLYQKQAAPASGTPGLPSPPGRP